MTALFLDTCTSYLNIGIVKDNKLIYKYQDKTNKEHSKMAMPELEKAIKETDENIDKIIVTIGPGSYTGIRIGVTIAKTYAWSKKIDVIPASSLKCMAISSKNKPNYLCTIDARRDNLFASIYDEKYNEIMPEKFINKVVLEELTEKKNFSKENEDTKLDILKIVNYYKDQKAINPHKLNPKYLKQTEAEENLL